MAAYLPSVVFSNNLVYVSGQDCRKDGQLLYKGKLGSDLTVDQGKECARQSMCNCLAALKYSIGDLDRVKRLSLIHILFAHGGGFGGDFIFHHCGRILLPLAESETPD